MKLKYIVDQIGAFSIFSEVCQHIDAARALTRTSFTDIEGAGFIDISHGEVKCFGESISLKIKSRGDIDAKIIADHLKLSLSV